MNKCISFKLSSFCRALLVLLPIFGLGAPAWGQVEGYRGEEVLLDGQTMTSETLLKIGHEVLVRYGPWNGDFISPGGSTRLDFSCKELPSWAQKFEGEKVLAIVGTLAYASEAILISLPEGGWVRVEKPAGYLYLNCASAAQGCSIELVMENEKGDTWDYYMGSPYEGFDLPQEIHIEDHFTWVELLHLFQSDILAPRIDVKTTQLVRLKSIIIRPIGIERQLAGVRQRYSLMTEEQHAELLAGPPPIAAGESKIELYIRDIRIGW